MEQSNDTELTARKGDSLIGAGLNLAQPSSLPQADLEDDPYIWTVGCNVSFLKMGCNRDIWE